MNYLHDRFGSGQIVRPPNVALGEVSFPNNVEPARHEWFVAETQPTGSPSGLDDSSSQILSPAAGTIIALDPDIPQPRSESSSRPAQAREIRSGSSMDARSRRFVVNCSGLRRPARTLSR